MALTVNSILTDTCNDVRNVLDPFADFNIMVGWVDRIHKDCLHSSVYSYLNTGFQFFTTIAGQAVYPFTTTFRRITTVYDYDRDRLIFALERAIMPVSQTMTQTPNKEGIASPTTKYGQGLISALSLQTSQPEYFKYSIVAGAPSMTLYPTPKQVVNIKVTGELQVATLVNSADQLLVPEDGRDIVVAGTNWMANMYLKRAEEAAVWRQAYEDLKRGNTIA